MGCYQITHGFPLAPSPLFLSNAFPTENRPGLHDQSMQVVITQLAAILKTSDAEIGDTGTWPGRIKKDVERWLSDWHLVTFLCMQGLFSLVSEDGRPKALFCDTDSRIFFPFFFFFVEGTTDSLSSRYRPRPSE